MTKIYSIICRSRSLRGDTEWSDTLETAGVCSTGVDVKGWKPLAYCHVCTRFNYNWGHFMSPIMWRIRTREVTFGTSLYIDSSVRSVFLPSGMDLLKSLFQTKTLCEPEQNIWLRERQGRAVTVSQWISESSKTSSPHRFPHRKFPEPCLAPCTGQLSSSSQPAQVALRLENILALRLIPQNRCIFLAFLFSS